MHSVGVVDIGLGNIFSIAQAFSYAGAQVHLIKQSTSVAHTDILILPGVGSFDRMMKTLNEKEYTSEVYAHIKKGKPLMGICLGMQLLFDESEETSGANQTGLSLLKGRVRRIPEPKDSMNYKIPNIGWRHIDYVKSNQPVSRYAHICYQQKFYFMHSFMADTPSDVDEIYFSDVGGCLIPAMIVKENIVCTQFHPEKSGVRGLALIQHFLEDQ